MKKAVRIITFYILPVLIALIVIVLIALPYVAKNYINNHGKEYVGRKMSVNQIRINYFTTTFNIIDFKLDVSSFLPYIKDYYLFKSIAGIIGGEFHLNGNINNLDSIAIRGDANVANFEAKDPSDRKVLGAKESKVTMNDSYPMKFVFNFDEIALKVDSIQI